MASAKAKIRHVFGDTFSCRAAPPDILVKLSGCYATAPQSRTQSNACSRVRLALALGKRTAYDFIRAHLMRMLSTNRLCFIYSGSTVVFMIILLEIKHSLLVESMRIK